MSSFLEVSLTLFDKSTGVAYIQNSQQHHRYEYSYFHHYHNILYLSFIITTSLQHHHHNWIPPLPDEHSSIATPCLHHHKLPHWLPLSAHSTSLITTLTTVWPYHQCSPLSSTQTSWSVTWSQWPAPKSSAFIAAFITSAAIASVTSGFVTTK